MKAAAVGRATARRSEPGASGRRSVDVLDLAGAALVGAAIGWTYVSAAASGGQPGPVAGVFLAATAAFVAGRLAAAVSRVLVPAAVVLAAGAVVLRAPQDVLSSLPSAGPFGYGNASAALFLQATVGALFLAAASRRVPFRVLGLVAAGVFAAVTLVGGSSAAVVLLLLPAGALAARDLRAARVAVALGTAAVVLGVALTAVLGATYRGEGGSGPAASVLTGRRLALWHDALAIMADNPATGIGPGRFQVESPVARSDKDTRQAHNEFLQQGAEQGAIGAVLLVLVFLWGYARLWRSAAPPTVRALGAAAITALGLHASIDYVLHFPAIAVTAAALVGAASAPVAGRFRSP